MNSVQTTKIQGGADYALVPARLKAFREANPNTSITTEPRLEGDNIVFKATIIKDKSDPSSAEATGHSYGKNTGNKAFEKLETVAVGRALSLLGYLNNGQVASTEEMEQFEEYKATKYTDQIAEAKTVEELMKIFNSMSPSSKKEFTQLLGDRRKELQGGTGTEE